MSKIQDLPNKVLNSISPYLLTGEVIDKAILQDNKKPKEIWIIKTNQAIILHGQHPDRPQPSIMVFALDEIREIDYLQKPDDIQVIFYSIKNNGKAVFHFDTSVAKDLEKFFENLGDLITYRYQAEKGKIQVVQRALRIGDKDRRVFGRGKAPDSSFLAQSLVVRHNDILTKPAVNKPDNPTVSSQGKITSQYVSKTVDKLMTNPTKKEADIQKDVDDDKNESSVRTVSKLEKELVLKTPQKTSEKNNKTNDDNKNYHVSKEEKKPFKSLLFRKNEQIKKHDDNKYVVDTNDTKHKAEEKKATLISKQVDSSKNTEKETNNNIERKEIKKSITLPTEKKEKMKVEENQKKDISKEIEYTKEKIKVEENQKKDISKEIEHTKEKNDNDTKENDINAKKQEKSEKAKETDFGNPLFFVGITFLATIVGFLCLSLFKTISRIVRYLKGK